MHLSSRGRQLHWLAWSRSDWNQTLQTNPNGGGLQVVSIPHIRGTQQPCITALYVLIMCKIDIEIMDISKSEVLAVHRRHIWTTDCRIKHRLQANDKCKLCDQGGETSDHILQVMLLLPSSYCSGGPSLAFLGLRPSRQQGIHLYLNDSSIFECY